jgi:hypothetical protein
MKQGKEITIPIRARFAPDSNLTRWKFMVQDKQSRIVVLEAKFSPVDIGHLLAGAEVDGEGKVFVSPNIGLKLEAVRKCFPCPNFLHGDDWQIFQDEAERTMKNEDLRWELERGNFNHRRLKSGGYEFVFRRWAEEP